MAAGGGGQRARNYRCAQRRLPSIVLRRTSVKWTSLKDFVIMTHLYISILILFYNSSKVKLQSMSGMDMFDPLRASGRKRGPPDEQEG